MSKKIVVIGAGPGGYVCAIRAAQLGAKVYLIEKEHIGGSCLNIGCIPTKVLIHTASIYQMFLNSAEIGLFNRGASVDWLKLQMHKKKIVRRLAGGVENLLKANGVKVCKGIATVLKDGKVSISNDKTNSVLTADAVVIAVGAESIRLDMPGSDIPSVITSTEALSLKSLPKSLIIIGGGVIGIEFAYLYNALGCKVLVIESLPKILPNIDDEIALLLKNELKRQGISIYTNARLISFEQKGEHLINCKVETEGEIFELKSELILMAVGRRPALNGLNLEDAGVRIEKGRIIVDEYYMTNVTNIYAIGDCSSEIMLAHAASAQGIAVAERIMGYRNEIVENETPYCIYTEPQVACVGLTEAEVVGKGADIKIGRFSLTGNGKSVIENEGTGMIKIIFGEKHGEVLGVHMFGPNVTEMISGATLAIAAEATADEFISSVYPHPTVSETIKEAAMDAFGYAIHASSYKKNLVSNHKGVETRRF